MVKFHQSMMRGWSEMMIIKNNENNWAAHYEV
jgi:hypothetical protein